MAVSNFHGTNPLVTHAPVAVNLQQLSGFKDVEYFDGQELFAQSRGAAQKRAERLTELFEQNVSSSQQSQPVLRMLLNRVLHWFGFKTESELVKRSFPLSSQSSCVTGLALGTFGSLLTQHPLPIILVLSSCFPSVQAQQKVGSEFQVNNYTANDQLFPSVASFPNGNFVVTWQSFLQDGYDNGIFGQLFEGNGSKIGNEFQVNNYTWFDQEYSSVTSQNNGNFVVTWQSYSSITKNLKQGGILFGIFGQIFNGTGAKSGSEFLVNTYLRNNQQNPSVGSLTSGNFVVAWESRDQDGSGLGVYGQVLNGTGVKIGSEFRINTFANGDQDNPSVASLNNNNFVVSWESSNQDFGSSVGVFGQLINENGSKVGSEFQVNNYTRDHQGTPSVTGLDTGNFVVTWYSKFQDNSTVSVFGQLFNESGNKIGSEFHVNTFTNNSQGQPSVASLKNNHFIVTWRSLDQDGSLDGIYGQLFDENGAKIGNEFQINIYTALEQSQPSVASLQNDHFIVTWHSNGQDGSGYGVYGQIFRDNITYLPTSSTIISSTTSTTSSSTTNTTSSKSSSTTSSSIMSTDNPSTKSSKGSLTARISKSSIFRLSSGISHEISSLPSISNKKFLWLLLGIGSGATCLGLTVIFFLKSRNKKENGDVLTSELGEMEQTNDSNGEREYQYTPDIVKPEDGRQYGRLSDREGEYQYTPDHVTQEEHYQRTPDHVHPYEE